MSIDTERIRRLLDYARSAPWPSVAANHLRQVTHPSAKIFMIGPNRCATTTFHGFFRFQGLKTIHWRHGDTFLAKEIDARLGDDEALRRFLSPWTVFSDLVYLDNEALIENHGEYETFQRLFPDAYFIFNDRDVDRWIESRIRRRGGDFVTRYKVVKACSTEKAFARWRTDFLAHREKTLAHFAGNPRFLHFSIDRADPKAVVGLDEVKSVVEFLKPDYRLSERYWALRNASADNRPAPVVT